jgi:hypothetical protein
MRFLGAPAGYEFVSLIEAVVTRWHDRLSTDARLPLLDRRRT